MWVSFDNVSAPALPLVGPLMPGRCCAKRFLAGTSSLRTGAKREIAAVAASPVARGNDEGVRAVGFGATGTRLADRTRTRREKPRRSPTSIAARPEPAPS